MSEYKTNSQAASNRGSMLGWELLVSATSGLLFTVVLTGGVWLSGGHPEDAVPVLILIAALWASLTFLQVRGRIER